MAITLSSLNDKTSVTGSEKIPCSGSGNPSLTPIILSGGLVNQQTDSYTLALTDAFKQVEISKATDITLTVPPNSSVAFPVGTLIYVKRTGVGVITVAQGVGVTVTASAVVLTDAGLNVVMTLRKTGTNTWDLQNGVAVSESSFTPTFAGFSSAPTNAIFRYQLVGKVCFWTLWMQDATTSNATTFTFTLPFTSKNVTNFSQVMGGMSFINSGSFGTTPGRVVVSPNSNIANCYTNAALQAWTASGDKRIFGSGFYIID